MANYIRDESIRRLHEQGLSLRKIAAHPDVVAANGGHKLSVGAVHAIVHANDQPDDEWGEPPANEDNLDAFEADLDRRFPVVEVGERDEKRDAAYVRKLIAEAFNADGRLNTESSLYRQLFCVRAGLRMIVVPGR